MSVRGKTALLAGFLLLAMLATAASRNSGMRIKVLDSETHSVVFEGSSVPKNCDAQNFDAYCNNSKTAEVTNTLLVQEGNGPPFRIACNIESKWSRCIPMRKGETLDARREKHGLVVYYVDDKGKARSQLYAFVTADGRPAPPPALSPAENAEPASDLASAPVAANPPANSKCSFTSTPAGAEVILDGQYVGSTPSVLTVGAGAHVVVMSTPGFAPWKRELTVSPGSDLTVNAVLEKAQ